MALDPNTFVFKTGKPVNEKQYERLKRELSYIPFGHEIRVSWDMIEDTFNPIIHIVTGIIKVSAFKKFEEFCNSNGFEFVIENNTRSYILRRDIDRKVLWK